MPSLEIHEVVFKVFADLDAAAMDAWRRDCLGVASAIDPRLKCVAVRTLLRTQDGTRVVSLVYLGLLE